MEKHLRSYLTTGFLALAQATSANAQEERPPYPVTRDCAIEALREAFAPAAIEIMEEETGVGAFVSIGDAQASSLISIDPQSGMVNWIDVQTQSADPAIDLYAVAKLDYKDGTQNGEMSAGGKGQIPVESAVALTRQLDDKLRECSQTMLLGSLKTPSPFKLG